MRSPEIAEALRDLARHVGRADPRRPRDVLPGARERLVNGRDGDRRRLEARPRKRGANGGRDHLGDARLPHEAFLIRVRVGMLARGVDVDEVVRQARPADQPRRAAVGDQRGCAAVALHEMQSIARPPRPPLACRDQRFATPQQSVQQSRDRAATRPGHVMSARFRRKGEGVDQQRRMRPFEKGRGGRGEVDRIRCAIGEARGFQRHRQCVLVPARDGAKACATAAKPGEFQRPGGRRRGQGAIAERMRRQRRCLYRETTPLRLNSSFHPRLGSAKRP